MCSDRTMVPCKSYGALQGSAPSGGVYLDDNASALNVKGEREIKAFHQSVPSGAKMAD